ncbi:conserved hypothetical protein [Candidatus Desulfarcum epimagneticum]|uniref:Thiamine biosynthesis protein ThiS n=1 Tax=uncultured Desulfobacteraceae bacterium TaxID=218296 RepID=A0A484HE19_9BACT|nr:conserved hypothetical protein [uncultured Desulfobacteraceae bacterium]
MGKMTQTQDPPGHIRVVVNGFEETVSPEFSIYDLMARLREGDRDLIVEHNGRFVFPARYKTTRLSPGDRIEMINPNFGG